MTEDVTPADDERRTNPCSRRIDVSRNLLLGLLAHQNDFIDREALLGAFNAWVADRSRGLGRTLLDRGALPPARRQLLEALVDEHIRLHGDDPEKSLAALSSIGPVRDELSRIADADLRDSLARVSATRPVEDDDPGRTASHASGAKSTSAAAGASTSAGARFRILRPHARGGLGEVFVALDTELNRDVALKEIQHQFADDPLFRARFEFEAEVTGGLEHPGIVPVYGLGHTPDGRPFYAMRFIRGDSLKDAVRQYHEAEEQPGRDPGRSTLELRDLLGRFIDVCDAVAYAHSRGVLHRDLKPGNIMLGRYGETLVVDWGLAKALEQAGPEGTTASRSELPLSPSSGSNLEPTVAGSAIGTPSYMSPEQAFGRLDQLGPWSDVYCLGATLYHLLTGHAPCEGETIGEVIRKVRSGDIPHPRALNLRIAPALEAICLKSLALEPGDRYASAEALKADLERWLADEPVSAWREPFAMRARRWARRNRTAVAGAAAALVVGVLGLSAVAVVQSRANSALESKNVELIAANAATTRAKDAAETALAETTKAKKATEEALGFSEESRRRAEAVLAFLKDDVLAATRPEGQDGGLGKDVSVRKAIDVAEPKIAAAFKDQPVVEAEVRGTLAMTYWYMGDAPLAIRQHERALELRQAKLGPDHPDTLENRNNLANAYLDAGRTDEAIAMHEVTLKAREAKLGLDHRATLISRDNLATAYWTAGRVAEAIKLTEAMLKVSELTLGVDHPDTLISRSNLANAYLAAGRIDEAVAMFEANLERFVSKLGPDHPDTLIGRSNLAVAYEQAGRIVQAVRIHEVTLALSEPKLGPDHPSTLITRNNLGQAYLAAGRSGEAIAMQEATVRLFESKSGLEHPYTLQVRNNLATAYESLGRWSDAEALRRDTLGRRRAGEKLGSPLLGGDLAGLGRNLLKQERGSAAEPILRESLAIFAEAAPDGWRRYDAASMLGGALLGQGRYAEAEPLIVPGYEGMNARQAKIQAAGKHLLAEATVRVVRLYEAWGKPAQAVAWKEKLGLIDLPTDVFAMP
jgi:eukaryotic-like serine/threonine-protein kinase